ncbi:MAG: hypothetical protein QM601_02930 [Pseudoxanthomonas sp.]
MDALAGRPGAGTRLPQQRLRGARGSVSFAAMLSALANAVNDNRNNLRADNRARTMRVCD